MSDHQDIEGLADSYAGDAEDALLARAERAPEEREITDLLPDVDLEELEDFILGQIGRATEVLPELPLIVGARVKANLQRVLNEVRILRRELDRWRRFEKGEAVEPLTAFEITIKPPAPTAGIQKGRELKLDFVETVMESLNISRGDLAAKLGVTREAVINTLRPGTRVSLERALSYAKALTIRLDEIVDLD